MMVSTCEAFLERLKQSRILSDQELMRAENLVGGEEDTKAAARRLVTAGLVTLWQANQVLKGKTTLSLGKYVLLDRLPWGSSRTIFLAKHPMMDRKVALNVLDRDSSSRSDSVQGFISDARSIAALDHRHLIHVYDVDEADDRYFLVMEHVEGQNLHDVVKKDGPMSFEVAADIVRQIADGLDHAHRNGLVHAGLRPTNVLLDSQGITKILDLGVSKLDDPTQTPAQSEGDSKVMDIASFLAPEQASGAAATAGSDIYALGCIAFYLLTGKPPFDKGNYTQRLQQHQHEAVPDPRKLRRDIPPGLAEIVMQMMAKSPGERFASAKDVVAALEQWWSKYAAELEASKPKPKPAPKPAAPRTPQAARPPGQRPAPGRPASPATRHGGPMPGKPRAPSRPGAAVAGAAVTTNGARAAAPPPARQEAAQEAESAKKSGGKRFTWLIILGAVLGGLAMSALGAGIAVALLLPGEKPGEAVAAGEGDSTNENSNEATTGESDNNADGGAATGGEDGDNEQENGDDGENGGAEDDPELPQPGAGDEPEENGSGSENVGEVPPPVEPPVSPPEGEPGSEEPPAEEPPKEKPPAEKPPKEQPPQEKPKDPFRELVKAYDLPMPKSDGEGTPVNLGKVLLPEDGIVYIDLLGGDKAVPKEKGTFSLARARGGLAERDWEFKLTTGADTETVIANMTLKENDLLFKWAPEAAGSDIVEYLANCQLNLRTRDAEHFLGLRDVQQVEALPVRFDQALLRERYKIPGAPDPKSMVVEITKVEGAKATIVKPTLTAAQDTTIVSFGEGDEQLLGVKIDTAMQKDLQITVTPVMKGPGGAPIKFNLRQVSSLYNQTLAAVTQMQSVVKQIDKGKYKNDKEKKQAKQRAEAKLKQLEEGLASFDTLNKQYEQISGKAYVQFRVYLPDGDSKLELVQGIKPPPAPDAPEKEEP